MRAHRNCCGLDVHKKIIAACLIREDTEGDSVREKRLFGTMTRDLHELAQWLCAAQVTAVAIGSLQWTFKRSIASPPLEHHALPDRSRHTGTKPYAKSKQASQTNAETVYAFAMDEGRKGVASRFG